MGLEAVTATSSVLGVGWSLAIKGISGLSTSLALPSPVGLQFGQQTPHILPLGYQTLPDPSLSGLAREAHRASSPSVHPRPPARNPHHALLMAHFLATPSFQEHHNTLAVPLPFLPLTPTHKPGWLRHAGAMLSVVPKGNHCLCNCRLLFLAEKLLKQAQSERHSRRGIEPQGERYCLSTCCAHAGSSQEQPQCQ